MVHSKFTSRTKKNKKKNQLKMASLFPACIKYKQDFDQTDMKTDQLERTLPGGRKIKSKVFQFDGTSVEMLFLCKQRFDDAMVAQALPEADWQEEFGRTLHGDPGEIWTEVIDSGDDNDVAFAQDAAGFELAMASYVKKYVADPNARDTMVAALNTNKFRFGLNEDKSVERHIRRLRTIIRYLPLLPGDAVVNPASMRHIVMNSFPKRWQTSFMRSGARRYHTTDLDEIQQHMTFEHALEESQKPTPKSDKNKKLEKDKKWRARRSQPYNNNYESHFQDGGRGYQGRGGGRGG